MRYWMLPALLCSAAVFAKSPPQLNSTPEQTMATLWRALSHEPGIAADVKSLQAIFHPDAVVFGATYKEGQPKLSQSKATEFFAGHDSSQAQRIL